MKTLFLSAFLLSTAVMAAPVKDRKVSNSNYFTCNLERDNVDKNVFKRQYHFPFPSEKGEKYELKGSMRWNEFKLVFHQSGQVDISISEGLGKQKITVGKTHQMGKEPQFESFKLQLDLKKDDLVIPYFIQCGPE